VAKRSFQSHRTKHLVCSSRVQSVEPQWAARAAMQSSSVSAGAALPRQACLSLSVIDPSLLE
jgi:hypothetical protein